LVRLKEKQKGTDVIGLVFTIMFDKVIPNFFEDISVTKNVFQSVADFPLNI
jgi:hypothetical protein